VCPVVPIAKIAKYGAIRLIVIFALLITAYLKMVLNVNITQVLINVEDARLVFGKIVKFAKNVNLTTN
jgi:hypothetical protein